MQLIVAELCKIMKSGITYSKLIKFLNSNFEYCSSGHDSERGGRMHEHLPAWYIRQNQKTLYIVDIFTPLSYINQLQRDGYGILSFFDVSSIRTEFKISTDLPLDEFYEIPIQQS